MGSDSLKDAEEKLKSQQALHRWQVPKVIESRPWIASDYGGRKCLEDGLAAGLV